MSTTIDSLQIEIKSNSSNAAASIRDLATSLGELKKNGTISVAVKNLNNLSAALRSFSTMPSPASKIGALTSALQALKNVGSVASIANSMTKLSAAMKAAGSLDTGGMESKMANIAGTLGQLSGVKASGFTSIVNSLGKIGKVTESLNDEAIGKFADKIRILNEKLEPLSAKMTTIQAGFRSINTNARSASGGVEKLGNEVNTTTLNMASMVTVVQGLIAALQPVIQLLTEAIGQAIEWDGVAARFGRGFGESADEAYQWVQRLNEELGINIQQFMQYSSVYSTMLTGFGVAMEDAGKMALGYTELTYDIWAGYNDVYKNFADAAEAVKSAIAGEVEPIRRAGFTIVESTLEQTAKNHGLTISLEKATEAEKSYLRYLTLVDQAHSQSLVGTYAEEMDTAEGLVRTLTQQIKSLTQAFGSLFLPILEIVIPYIQAFVEILTEAVQWLAALFGFKIQSVDWSGFGDGVDNLDNSVEDLETNLGNATQAAEDLKKATLGIDELNVISPSSSTSGSSGSSGSSSSGFSDLTVESLWDESIFKDVQDKVDEIKSKLEDDLLPLIGTVGAALALWKISNLLDQLGSANTVIKGLSTGLKIGAISILVGKLVWDFTDAYLESGDWLEWLKALGTTAIGTGLAYKFGGKGGAGFVLVVSGVAMLANLAFNLSEGTVDFGDPETWITLLTGSLEAGIGAFFTWKTVKPILEKYWPQIMSAIGTAITKISSAIGGAGGSVLGTVSASTVGWVVAIVAYIAGLIAFGVADYDFTDIGKQIGEKIGEAIKYSLDAPKRIAGAIGKVVSSALEQAKDFFDVETFGGLVEALFDWEVWWTKIRPALDEWAKNIWDSIWGALTDFSENFTENEKELVDGFWTGFLSVFGVSEENALKLSPEHILMTPQQMFEYAVKLGKELFPGIDGGLKEAWDNNVLVNKVKEAWNAVKTWWNDKKGVLKTYTPTIGSISTKLSTAWSSAKTWWSKTRGSLSTYTPSIGSIKTKLSSAWTTAKNWWNKNKGSMSYTPTIGSIKSKLMTAWSTAKKWWNDNVKLSIPSLSFKVTYTNDGLGAVKKAIVNALDLPGWPKLSFAANGGIFDMGSLIWAGERGAEIVANAGGGKTGVMNVDQMQDAVFEGVYSAVMAAMSRGNGNGGQNVNVYLDGKQIYSSVKRTESERGMTLMGNQLGYNF